MKKSYQNIIIGFVGLLAIAFIVVWISTIRQDKEEVEMPDIYTNYSVNDFSELSMDSESIQRLVDKLNKDYSYLREGAYDSELQHYNIWIDIGNVKFALEDYDGAVEIWEYATTINDINPLAYSNLANYYKSFARDYEQAKYYYDQAINKDNIGYFFDYQAYAELYINYLPEDPSKVEIIMLEGVEKAVGNTKLDFYTFLYNYFSEKGDKNKIDTYKNKVLEIDPNYQF